MKALLIPGPEDRRRYELEALNIFERSSRSVSAVDESTLSRGRPDILDGASRATDGGSADEAEQVDVTAFTRLLVGDERAGTDRSEVPA